jgi:hypothetical protein
MALRVNHVCNNQILIYDSLLYINAAGEAYRIEHLEYYLSDFTLYSSDGTIYTDSSVYYIDARSPEQVLINLDSIPPGHYYKMTCHVGVDSLRNVEGSLPNTMENAAMVWPEFMGGGYHFMKLEGRFQSAALWGFAVHLGSNQALPLCEMQTDFALKYINHSAMMTMDVNEWFQIPHTYSFINDGNYTMGNQILMGKIRDNGKDVLSIIQTN